MSCAAQGYEEAVEIEQRARNLVYLAQPEIVLGEPLNNITPALLARLSVMRSPFYAGGNFTHAHVAAFLWALHRDYRAGGLTAWSERRRLRKKASDFTLQHCRDEIAAFMDLTFMDSPKGAEEKPIASGTAWLVYRFRHDPWRMSEAETINTPLRKLYQELRCWMKEQGEHVSNRSDEKTRTWAQQINEALRTGAITQSQLDEANARWAKERRN